MTTLPAIQQQEPTTLTPANIKAQVDLIQQVMKAVMKENEHYGKIPGCGDKPTLLKPGAEKLSSTFRLVPKYEIQARDLPGGHREYEIICSLYHVVTGAFWGQGVGMASTMESKYRYRKQERMCPKCGAETIIKGKQQLAVDGFAGRQRAVAARSLPMMPLR